MASLESKLLDGPSAGYCSSSDEEEDSGFKVVNNEDEHQANVMKRFGGQQTGPKGVLQDYKDHHASLAQQKLARDAAILSQAERGMFQTSKEERELANQSSDEDDDSLESLRKKRLLEMKKALSGRMIELTDKNQFLSIIENSNHLVGILIYEPGVEDCDLATRLCKILSAEYENVKFARATSTVLGMTERYKTEGVPTLQFYAPGGHLVGSFVRFTDQIGQDSSIAKLKTLLKKHRINLKESRVMSDSEYSSDE